MDQQALNKVNELKNLSSSPDGLALRKQELLSLLKQTAPEVISDNQIDVERLKDLLGQEALAPAEHYELNWAGKAAARREIQKTTIHTLQPAANNPENAQHMLIEGENLEVLRVLQKSYYGKVKMIYIDPPYNTGNDSFVYPDDYSETLDEYLKRTGEKSEAGFLNKQTLWKKNTKESGQYHSAWLSMMYPRLYLARNLLRDDGVIFISIDDNEAANLKLLCDEVFGAENFRNLFAARRHDKNLNLQFIDSGLKTFNVGFEYVLCYSKSLSFNFNPIFREANEKRQNLGYWKGFWNAPDRPTMRYDILGFCPNEGQWKWREELAREAVSNYEIFLANFADQMTLEKYWESTGKLKKFLRRNLNGSGKNMGVEHWIPPSEGVLRNSNLLDILVTQSNTLTAGFDFPKNVELIKLFVACGSADSDLILDFFSGSGTTAQAVLESNLEDEGSRQCICVQMPEILEEDNEAYKAGYRTIADITRARIDKVITKLKNEHPEKTTALACANFKLAPSNFKTWRTDVSDVDALREQLHLFQSAEKTPNAWQDNQNQTAMLTELLLKHGLGVLGVHAISKPKTLAGVTVHRVLLKDDKHLWLCFEPYSEALKNEIVSGKPDQVILLNSCFVGEKADEQISNLQLELAGLEIALLVI